MTMPENDISQTDTLDEAESAPSREGRILILDDEMSILDILEQFLQEEGYDCCCAQSPIEALEKLESENFTLLVTDLKMPIMSGDEFIENLRTNERTGDIPVVMLTARDFEMDDEMKQRLGISACMSKPFSPRELVRTVKKILKTQAVTA